MLGFSQPVRIWYALLLLFTASAMAAPAETNPGTGEFGTDLAILRSFYTPPKRGHSNHIIDMWAGNTLAGVLLNAGLTNNNMLVINSHAKGIQTAEASRHAYYPHEAFIGLGRKPDYFSAADIANTLGRKAVKRIHNIVLAGCNREGTFDASELRKLFPNATNIIHMTAGEAGYQPMFLQVFLTESANIRPIYQVVRRTPAGSSHFDIVKSPAPAATRLSPYVAELFTAGNSVPFRIQTAGRELLDPDITCFSKIAHAGLPDEVHIDFGAISRSPEQDAPELEH